VAARRSVQTEDAALRAAIARHEASGPAGGPSGSAAAAAAPLPQPSTAAQPPPTVDANPAAPDRTVQPAAVRSDAELPMDRILSPAEWAALRFPVLAKFPVLPKSVIKSLDKGYNQYLDNIDRRQRIKLNTGEARRRARRDAEMAREAEGRAKRTEQRDAAAQANRNRTFTATETQRALSNARADEAAKLARQRFTAELDKQRVANLRQVSAEKLARDQFKATQENRATTSAREDQRLRLEQNRLDALNAQRAQQAASAAALRQVEDTRRNALPMRDFERALMGGPAIMDARTGVVDRQGEPGIIGLAGAGAAGWIQALKESQRLRAVGLTPEQESKVLDVLQNSAPTLDDLITARDNGDISPEDFDTAANIIDPDGRLRAMRAANQPSRALPALRDTVGRHFGRLP